MHPTWTDHNDLNFWLWACLEDAHVFLESSRQHSAAIKDLSKNWPQSNAERLAAQARLRLSTYHFVMTTGTLVKTLTRLVPLFPAVQLPFDAAEHLKREGLDLRNMIEHSEINLAAAKKGTPRGGFVRKSNLLPELPGSRGGTADATSLIIDQNGHWLGGRLNVERIIAEVRAIYEVAQGISAPSSYRPSI